MIEPLWTSTQIAEVSRIPKRTISNWIAHGVLVPDEKSEGSGSLNRFAKCEAEIAVLLTPIHFMWSIKTSELKNITNLFREVMTLNQFGFLAERQALQKMATEMIAGDGPALLSPRGTGRGESERDRAKREEFIKATTMTETEARKFWAYVCYGIAKHKKNNAAWEVWFNLDGEFSLYPRLYFDRAFPSGHYGKDQAPHGLWRNICIGDHSQRGMGMVIDLLPLGEDR